MQTGPGSDNLAVCIKARELRPLGHEVNRCDIVVVWKVIQESVRPNHKYSWHLGPFNHMCGCCYT